MSNTKKCKVGRDDYIETIDGVKHFECPNCGNPTPLGKCECGAIVSWSIGRGMYSRDSLSAGGLGYYGHDGKLKYY